MSGNIIKLYPQYNKDPGGTENKAPAKPDNARKTYFGQTVNPADEAKLKQEIGQIRDTFSRFTPKPFKFTDDGDKVELSTKKKQRDISMSSKTILNILSPIPYFRRISSAPDNARDGNYARIAGILGLLAINLPEDTRDIKAAGKQIWSKLTKGVNPYPLAKEYQHDFTFLRGTLLEPVVNRMGKLGAKLFEWDIPLFDTKFGEKMLKLLKLDIDDVQETGRLVPKVIIEEGKSSIEKMPVYAIKLKGNSLAKLIGRALRRIPLFSVAILGAIETPFIIKSFIKGDKPKDKLTGGAKQTLKSTINVVSITSGIGIVGALLAAYGPAGSLIGMGIGSIIGSLVSKFAGKLIDRSTNDIYQ